MREHPPAGRVWFLFVVAACGPMDADPAATIRSGPLPGSVPASLYDSAAVDFDGDGTKERLQLYVDADRTPSGEMVWDDGHRWVLLARDPVADEVWVLADRSVQLGRLGFWAMERAEGAAAAVVILADGGSVVEAERLLYQPADRSFRRTGHIVSDGIMVARPGSR